ncbi:hypothetical protein LTR66_009401 [Elasticomyces elasticus]|nr:hypothetical protein LTR66_009401 [Elasticomyces elasticus]
MAGTSKPTLVLVHGSFHGPWCWDDTIPHLKKLGYHVVTHQLYSVGGEPNDDVVAIDAKGIHETLAKELEENDVVLVVHSYAGVCGSEALGRLAADKTERNGKVLRIIYVAAFVLPVGVSLLQAIGGKHDPVDDRIMYADVDPFNIFYNGVPRAVAEATAKRLTHQVHIAYETPVSYAAHKQYPSAYLFCTNDNALPYAAQQAMVEGSGVEMRTHTMQTSHSPFLEAPEDFALAIDGLIKGV